MDSASDAYQLPPGLTGVWGSETCSCWHPGRFRCVHPDTNNPGRWLAVVSQDWQATSHREEGGAAKEFYELVSGQTGFSETSHLLILASLWQSIDLSYIFMNNVLMWHFKKCILLMTQNASNDKPLWKEQMLQWPPAFLHIHTWVRPPLNRAERVRLTQKSRVCPTNLKKHSATNLLMSMFEVSFGNSSTAEWAWLWNWHWLSDTHTPHIQWAAVWVKQQMNLNVHALWTSTVQVGPNYQNKMFMLNILMINKTANHSTYWYFLDLASLGGNYAAPDLKYLPEVLSVHQYVPWTVNDLHNEAWRSNLTLSSDSASAYEDLLIF